MISFFVVLVSKESSQIKKRKFLGSEKLLDKFGERQNLPQADVRLHGDELVEVVSRLGCRDRRVSRRRLHPRSIRLLHVAPIGREGREKDGGRNDPEESVIFRVEDCVRAERLGDVLVEKRREGKVGVLKKNYSDILHLNNRTYLIWIEITFI